METLADLEDVYLPFKPRRRTRASIAREKGLEPLAYLLFAQDPAVNPHAEALAWVQPEAGIASADEALSAARDIIAEWVNESGEARSRLRSLFAERAVIRSRVIPSKQAEALQYRDYFDWEEPVKDALSHRILAARRGQKEGFLTVHIAPPEEDALSILETFLVKGDTAAAQEVRAAVHDAYRRLPDAAKDRLADDLAIFFAELHALDPAVMRDAGALPVGAWDTGDETLAPVWPLLPPDCVAQARAALDAYRALGPDPLGERYGFFDAHGWNMAFDAGRRRLNGIFDFADSGFGPVHREFAPVSLIDPDLTARTAAAYERGTGNRLDRRRIFLLTAAMRLSELAGEIAARGNVEWVRDLVIDWFSQTAVR